MSGQHATTQLLETLVRTIDHHRWEELPALLHPELEVRLVHTGETFDRAGWVRLNAEYPGFDDMELLELVVDGEHAATRCLVRGRTTDERPVTFQVAGFATLVDGLVHRLTEVWTDVDQAAPAGTRPTD